MTKNNTTKLQHFATEDLHLAAYLLCQDNLEFKGIENGDHQETKKFAFEGEDKYIDELVLDYINCRGTVEPQQYDKNIGILRDLVKLKVSNSKEVIKITEKTEKDC